jgi:hypothetical protein
MDCCLGPSTFGQLFGFRGAMKQVVREAFLAIRGNASPDVVIANADLNKLFIDECRTRGLTDSAVVLNQCLYNLRKSRRLQGLRSKPASVEDQEDYRFGSEIAIRRRDQLTLDQILCDPARAQEFDAIAATIAPGFSPFQYRWAALNLRKRKRLKPELLGRLVPSQTAVTCRIEDLDIATLPASQGLYLFFEPTHVLYVGECKSLRQRITKHLDHSDNKGLARWLWQHGATELHVEYHVLPQGTPTRVRKALETELIRSRKPYFNTAGVEDEG